MITDGNMIGFEKGLSRIDSLSALEWHGILPKRARDVGGLVLEQVVEIAKRGAVPIEKIETSDMSDLFRRRWTFLAYEIPEGLRVWFGTASFVSDESHSIAYEREFEPGDILIQHDTGVVEYVDPDNGETLEFIEDE